MNRRIFLLQAAALAGAGLASAQMWRQLHEITPTLSLPGRTIGHALRDAPIHPTPQQTQTVDVLIIGSGAAGLSCAWQLAQNPMTSKLSRYVLEGPEANGNLAYQHFHTPTEDFLYPTGAHYLPLPSVESTHIRRLLDSLGVITADAQSTAPTYDERTLVHAPHERLWMHGTWQDGLMPKPAPGSRDEQQINRFLETVSQLRQAIGQDGMRVFTVPIALASQDPIWTQWDKITFSDWLDQAHYDSPLLRWYLDYCCRDDYGANSAQVSAWAGLHYFCARDGHAANAEPGSVLTWPNGLGWLADQLRQGSGLPDQHFLAASAYRITPFGTQHAVDVMQHPSRNDLRIIARHVVCACPLFVASRLFPPGAYDHLAALLEHQHLPIRAPWLVSNFLLKHPLTEARDHFMAWDNVVFGSPSLGFVNATHQMLRVGAPQTPVLTAYHALADQTPTQARHWLETAPPQALLDIATQDLVAAYGHAFLRAVSRAEITVRAHAMATPSPGFLSNPLLNHLRTPQKGLYFAHADLSGYSVFEEASYWGMAAADEIARTSAS